MSTTRNNCKSLYVRPSKREEKLSRQPSEAKAFEVAEEWAATIKEMHLTDRFGVKMKKVGRWNWDVILVDRSIPEDE